MKPNSETIQCVYQPSHSKQIHKQRHLLLSLTALIFMLICESSAAADNGAFFVNKWGSQGVVLPDFHGSTGINSFEGPSGVAIDSSGNIYVADQGNRIRKYKPTGEVVLGWGGGQGLGSGTGQFNNPCGIAVDSEDNVYVADEYNHRIQKFDSSGNHLQTIGGNQYPDTGIHFQNPYAVAAWGGNLYVADTNNNRVLKIQFNHTVPGITREWTTYGTGHTPFNKPRGIAVDSAGNVYVADSENHRIVKFDSSDAYVNQWGSLGSGDLELRSPRGVAVDGNGAVYVADYYNHRIKKYASNGNFIGKWGSHDTGDGQFSFPPFVAVGKGCEIVVSDHSNLRVQKFACDNTNYHSQWGSQGTEDRKFNRPMGITLDSSGNIYVADTDNNRIQKVTSTGGFLAKWGRSDCLPGAGDGEFNHPTGVAVDRFGNIYVADRDNNRVVKLSKDGNFIWEYPDPDSGDPPPTLPLNHPTRIATSWEMFGDFVYVVDGNKVVSKLLISPSGAFLSNTLEQNDSGLGYFDPRSVLSDNHHIYLVNESDPYPGIRKFQIDTNAYDDINYIFRGQQQGYFSGLAMDGDQNFYSFNISTNHIYKFLSEFASSGISNPSSYVYTHTWGASGSGNGQFNHPSDIAVDKNCNIYVVDAENHRIQKFSTVPPVLIKFPQ